MALLSYDAKEFCLIMSCDKTKSITQEKHPFIKYLAGISQDILFFAFFFCYFKFYINPVLIYHGAGLINNIPVFYKGYEFFRGYLNYPGGLLSYVSAFLTHLFALSWTGSLILTLQAIGLGVATDVILRSLRLHRWRSLRFVPALLLIVLYSDYVYQFPTTMAFLAALLAVACYERIRFQRIQIQCLWMSGLAVLVYIMSGGGLLLFVLLCGLIELFYRRRPGYACLALGLGLLLPYGLGMQFYGVSPHDAFVELLPFSWKIRQNVNDRNTLVLGGLWIFLPGLIALTGLGRLFIKQSPPSTPQANQPCFWCITTGTFGWNIATLVCLTATLGTSWSVRDENTKLLFQIDYDARYQHWDRILEEARGLPYNYLVCHAVDRALYHTGRLGEDLFCYAQHPQSLLLNNPKAMWHKFDTCLELGLVNEAENALTNCIEAYGERPLLLERLAWIHRIKGNDSTARVYQNALAKVPFHQLIIGSMQDESALQSIRSIQLQTDVVGHMDGLTSLLNDNPNNRMAYEYLMTRLLLQKNLEAFEQVFKALHFQHMKEVPQLYQEALLLNQVIQHKTSGKDLGISFSDELLQKAQFLFNELKRFKGDKQKARRALKESYGQSYFYYFLLTDIKTSP